MRVLLANHHLDTRGGSELYTAELASALRDRGAQPAVFTFVRGLVSKELEATGVPVFGPNDRDAIRAFSPDIVHAHHSPCLYFLGALGLKCPAVHSLLGVLDVLESPPVLFGGVGAGLVVSEEVRGAVRQTPFGRSVPLQIFRNWFDDRRIGRRVPSRGECRRVVVVSNHLDERLRRDLDSIAERRSQSRGGRSFGWTHVGLPEHSLVVDEEALEPFDVVVTIGRTVLLAGALGKPCVLYDVHGCDGILEPDRLAELATRNFSGRLSRSRPSLDELEALIFDAPSRTMEALQEMIWTDYRLTDRTRDVEQLHRVVSSTADASLANHAVDYGRVGDVHALMVDWWRDAAARAESAARRSAQLSAELSAERQRHVEQLEAERSRPLAERILETVRGSVESAVGRVFRPPAT